MLLESSSVREPAVLVWFTLTRFGPCVGFPWLSLSTSEGVRVFSLLFSVPLSALVGIKGSWSFTGSKRFLVLALRFS
jgi:hypothetical protein